MPEAEISVDGCSAKLHPWRDLAVVSVGRRPEHHHPRHLTQLSDERGVPAALRKSSYGDAVPSRFAGGIEKLPPAFARKSLIEVSKQVSEPAVDTVVAIHGNERRLIGPLDDLSANLFHAARIWIAGAGVDDSNVVRVFEANGAIPLLGRNPADRTAHRRLPVRSGQQHHDPARAQGDLEPHDMIVPPVDHARIDCHRTHASLLYHANTGRLGV